MFHRYAKLEEDSLLLRHHDTEADSKEPEILGFVSLTDPQFTGVGGTEFTGVGVLSSLVLSSLVWGVLRKTKMEKMVTTHR